MYGENLPDTWWGSMLVDVSFCLAVVRAVVLSLLHSRIFRTS